MKTILVTGSKGCLGSLIPEIEGYRIIRTDRETLDITDFGAVEELISVEKPEIIIHLAALLGSACNDTDLAMQVNVCATLNLLKVGQKYGLERFIFTSTCAVYDQMEIRPTTELDNIGAKNMYGISKYMAEQVLLRNATCKLTIFRIFNLYGDGFKNSLINKLKSGEELTIVNPDSYYRDYIHVSDVIHFIIRALDVKTQGVVFNLGSGEVRTTNQLIEEMIDTGCNPRYKRIDDGECTVSWSDNTKLKKVFGEVPEKGLKL